ncbi:MAG: dephospho-CoA kinase [SAR202 cluster bacterium]|nr:dephospho-CoA kinase [SAR202 cluster bacterium]
MKVIGLTGGIGTGKSAVAQILQELGAVLISADRLGHEAYKPNTETWRKVVDAFGPQVAAPSGEIDRRRLGAIVFADPKALKKLNAIVHPQIRRLAEQKLEELRKQKIDTIVVEAALLFEAGWDSLVDEVWVTYAPEDIVLKRLQVRDGLTKQEVQNRIKSQIPFDERAKRSSVIINNSGTPEQLREQVLKLWVSRQKEGTNKNG